MNTTSINPITKLDYPDPDVIRVDDTYYMVSTTMYFMPGCEILRSYDLIHWEHAAYVYDKLDSTPAQRLLEKENIYGQGMWAASLRYHDGYFFVCFVCNDTHKTYVYTSRSIEGPWEKSYLNGFYHDNSILFDDDDRIYIICGNKDIYLKELYLVNTKSGVTLTDDASQVCNRSTVSTPYTDVEEDLSQTPNADNKNPSESDTGSTLILSDSDNVYLGYEGAHFYKINGKYYIFLIHMPKSTGKRTEAVFVADKPQGPYIGKDVMDDDRGYRRSGVAQGGIVQSPSGKWYSILFQDSGAVGRIPVLMPVTWTVTDTSDFTYGIATTGENIESKPFSSVNFPVFGDNGIIQETFEIEDLRPGYKYTPLVGSDDFRVSKDSHVLGTDDNSSSGLYDSFGFKSCWQFNHEPEISLIKRDFDKGTVTITTDKLCDNLVQAKNILTQRTLFPGCKCSVDIDATAINDGDYAGLCILESNYCFIGVTKRNGKFFLVQGSREITTGGFWGERHDTESFDENACVEIDKPAITLKADICYDCAIVGSGTNDTAAFYFSKDSEGFTQFGTTNKLQFKLDHFTGARFGLFVYSTKKEGGSTTFTNFKY